MVELKSRTLTRWSAAERVKFLSLFGRQGECGFDDARALVIQGGKLVAAGSATTGSGPDFALARYRPNGDLDASFGAGGITTTDLTRREDRAQALVLQSGRPVAVGTAVNGSAKQTFALARYLN